MRNPAQNLVIWIVLAFTPLYGQTKAEKDRDEAEVKAYRLSMDKVRRIVQAQRNLQNLLKSDAAVANAIKAQERAARERDDDGPSGGTMVIGRAQKKLEAQPKVLAAVRSAGMDAREYVVANLAFAMAAAADFASKYGDKKSGEAVSPQNLQFVRQNETELKTLTEEMQRLNKEFEAITNPEGDEDKAEPEEKPAPKSRKK